MFWKLQENVINSSDLDLLVSFIKETNRFTQFTKVAEFEAAFAKWQGCEYCVYVNSGSSANLLMVNAAKEYYGWSDGDEIIVPVVTWPTTITPVIQFGLTPVFVDANLSDMSMDYEKICSKITSKTRAIFVAHLLGFPANIEKLKNIIEDRNIVILEDCCESQGAMANGSKVGNHGVAGSFSFYWGHHMTTVEGGMICTNNEELYKLFILKRSHGLARELPAKYHEKLKELYRDVDFNFLFLTDGFNVRNTEFNAVLGLAQLLQINSFIAQRNKNYLEFINICSAYEDQLILLDIPGTSSFVLPFLFREKSTKTKFQAIIQEAGIESRPIISGNLLRQPFLSKFYNPADYPNADFLHSNAFYIGNNQFVDQYRLDILSSLMRDFLKA
ncbi:MAG: DegT/DnrJ/EryC1/StrS aminotransferase family protein [Desulfuromonadaceae bacterium]|nr:DegT/DnrJ/EryC1/StrS aminotransferase family protein [Desulfuromonadaceae bacterium]